MKHAKWLFVGVVAFLPVLCGGPRASAQQSAIDLPDQPGDEL